MGPAKDLKKGDIVALSSRMLNRVEETPAVFNLQVYNPMSRFVVINGLTSSMGAEARASVRWLGLKGTDKGGMATHIFYHWKIVKVDK